MKPPALDTLYFQEITSTDVLSRSENLLMEKIEQRVNEWKPI